MTTRTKIATPNDLPDISLNVLPVDVTTSEVTEAVVRISVSEAEEASTIRLPVDVVAVIDVSGSMGSDATYEVDGEERCDGLRILDIAVHAVKVILSCLREEDRFALVSFNQNAELKYPLKNVSDKNRKEAEQVANSLKRGGQTNMWGGIEKGLDALRTAKVDSKYPTRNQSILLLTDGRPTSTPSGGHVNAFESYCRTNEFECQISCFGFGYKLDSKLMLELSQVGKGNFGFIPMAPVLGTVFTHALASVLSTYTTNSRLILHAPKSGKGSFIRQKMKGGLGMNTSDARRTEIDVGPLLFGQTRDIVIPMRFSRRKENNDKVVLEARLEFGGQRNQVSKVLTSKGRQVGYDSDAEIAKIRSAVSDTLLEVVSLGEKGQLNKAKKMLTDLAKLMGRSNEAYNERVVGLRNDITGRCSKALDGSPRFKRWGKHYIRALLRSHSVQQCTNKLDIGVQVYGGILFALMRRRGDEIFLKLPPPQPQQQQQTRSYSSSSSYNAPPPRTTPPVNINHYTGGGGGGGCFGGESTVIVFSQSEKEGQSSSSSSSSQNEVRVADVKKGDVVKVSGGTAKVVCVVHAVRKDSKPLVAIPGGPFITSKHPVRVDGRWRMPEGMGPMVETGNESGTVYNFVLEPRNAVLLVNGYECVVLGHGLKGKGVEHAFYGTERSLNQVRKLKGWEAGRVSIGEIVRDEMGHAKGFICTK